MSVLTALKAALITEFAETTLSLPVRGPKQPGQAPQVGKVNIYIGDLPPKSKGESVFPSIIICPIAGEGESGETFTEVAFLVGVFNDEEGDAEAAEMELEVMRIRIAKFLREALDVPVAERFTCIRDEKNRYMHWHRAEPLGQPRPFAQVAIISRWSMPGWE